MAAGTAPKRSAAEQGDCRSEAEPVAARPERSEGHAQRINTKEMLKKHKTFIS
jgi:hypothetical protein